MSVSAVCQWWSRLCVSDRILGKYLKELSNSSTETTRCGCALALGALPQSFLAGHLSHIITNLVAASKLTSKHASFVLSRRDCLTALNWYIDHRTEKFIATLLVIRLERNRSQLSSGSLWCEILWAVLLIMKATVIYTTSLSWAPYPYLSPYVDSELHTPSAVLRLTQLSTLCAMVK